MMTPETLLAMSEVDYMNAHQLEYFQRMLEAMREEILQNVAHTSELLRQSSELPDPVDRATQEEEQAIELRTRDRERKLLRKIESALNRIATGQYGYCEETGEPIGIKRLLARPTATLSIEAQERHERRERQFRN
jgi:DnaK suppressor protein